MRMLWRSAGGDKYILERATYADQIKYMCLGGIILSTGVMAGIAGGYAFYTIFQERGPAMDQTIDYRTSFLSIIFGTIWGLIIFNIDRFIVTSTGKGDGTEAITWDEFKGAIPRIIMGAIIALTISKPVEIRMFKTEIDVELHKEQMVKQQEYLAQIDSVYKGRIEGEKAKVNGWLKEIVDKEVYKRKLEDDLIKEMGGLSGPAGLGPEAQKIAEMANKSVQDLEVLNRKNQVLIDSSYTQILRFEKAKREDIGKGEKVAAGLDGLLERIKLAHKIAGFWISLFITLLFMVIELTPIFFKLMLVKTPYDYLEENIKELIKADAGIHVLYNYYKDKEGLERDLVKYLNADKIITEQVAARESERRLSIYAMDKYEERMKKKIDENPEFFIHSEPKES